MPRRQINCTFTAAGDYSEFYGRTTEKQQQPITLLLKLLVRVNKRLKGGEIIHLTGKHLSSFKRRQFELKRQREEFKKTKEEEVGGGEKTNRSFCCCCCWQRAAAQEKGRTRTSVSERPPLSPSSSTRTPAPPAASSWPSSPSSAASGWRLEEEDSYHVTHWQISILSNGPFMF